MIPAVMLGEKDHGKSTLLGRLLYETKSIASDRIEEVKKIDKKLGKPFEWAHLLDSFLYERENDMTLDTTRVIMRLGKNLYEFIDVPGHEELIKNMLSGASEAQNAILVVSAKKGVEPQTINHLKIAEFLGIKNVIVAINKIDQTNYSQEKFNGLRKSVHALLDDLGFEKKIILPISAYGGDNLLASSKNLEWFGGPTLIEAIQDGLKMRTEKNKKSFLMFVQDVYPGSIVVGQIKQGELRKGQKIKLHPARSLHTARNIFSGNNKIVKAGAGEIAGVSLEPTPKKIERGYVLAFKRPEYYEKFEAECIFIKKPAEKQLFLESGGQLAKIIKMDFHYSNSQWQSRAQLKLDKQLVLPDKFVIKEEGTIIGLGKIIK